MTDAVWLLLAGLLVAACVGWALDARDAWLQATVRVEWRRFLDLVAENAAAVAAAMRGFGVSVEGAGAASARFAAAIREAEES